MLCIQYTWSFYVTVDVLQCVCVVGAKKLRGILTQAAAFTAFYMTEEWKHLKTLSDCVRLKNKISLISCPIFCIHAYTYKSYYKCHTSHFSVALYNYKKT